MKQNITELVGSLFLVLIAGLTSDPLAIGISYGVLLCLTLPVSDGYLNPAITLARVAQKKMGIQTAIQYWVAQIIGGILGALLVWLLQGTTISIFPADGLSMRRIGLFEGIFTLLLAITAIITTRYFEQKYIIGLLSGLMLFVILKIITATTGGIINPTLAIGGAITDWIHGGVSGSYLWLYLVATLVGGFVAGKAITYNSDYKL